MVPARQGLPSGPVGTGHSSRGHNSAFVSFVWTPEQGWALLLYKGIFWWGLVPLSLLSTWGWRRVLLAFRGFCQKLQGWQMVGAQLCWYQSQGTGAHRVKNSMSPYRAEALWAGWCCAPGTAGELTEPPESLQLLSGALPRCCCSHWGEASPEGNASGLLACQQVAEVLVGGFPRVSGRSWEA